MHEDPLLISSNVATKDGGVEGHSDTKSTIGERTEQRQLLVKELEKSGSVLSEAHLFSALLISICHKLKIPADVSLFALDTEDADQVYFDSSSTSIVIGKGLFSVLYRNGLELSEDHLASVLAHEYVHSLRHQRSSKSAVQRTVECQLAGHSEEQEADRVAMTMLAEVGYNPLAYIDVLRHLSEAGRHGASLSHPADLDRINHLLKIVFDDEHPITGLDRSYSMLSAEMSRWIGQPSNEVYQTTDRLMSANSTQLREIALQASSVDDFIRGLTVWRHVKKLENAHVLNEHPLLAELTRKAIVIETITKDDFFSNEEEHENPLRNNQIFSGFNGPLMVQRVGVLTRALEARDYRVRHIQEDQQAIVWANFSEQVDEVITVINEMDARFSQLIASYPEQFDSGQASASVASNFLRHLRDVYYGHSDLDAEVVGSCFTSHNRLYQEWYTERQQAILREKRRAPETAQAQAERLKDTFVVEQDKGILIGAQQLTFASRIAPDGEIDSDMRQRLIQLLQSEGVQPSSANLIADIILSSERDLESQGFDEWDDQALFDLIDCVRRLEQVGLRLSPVRELHQQFKASFIDSWRSDNDWWQEYQTFELLQLPEQVKDTVVIEILKRRYNGPIGSFNESQTKAYSVSDFQISTDDWRRLSQFYPIRTHPLYAASLVADYLDAVKQSSGVDQPLMERVSQLRAPSYWGGFFVQEGTLPTRLSLTIDDLELLRKSSPWDQLTTFVFVIEYLDIHYERLVGDLSQENLTQFSNLLLYLDDHSFIDTNSVGTTFLYKCRRRREGIANKLVDFYIEQMSGGLPAGDQVGYLVGKEDGFDSWVDLAELLHMKCFLDGGGDIGYFFSLQDACGKLRLKKTADILSEWSRKCDEWDCKLDELYGKLQSKRQLINQMLTAVAGYELHVSTVYSILEGEVRTNYIHGNPHEAEFEELLSQYRAIREEINQVEQDYGQWRITNIYTEAENRAEATRFVKEKLIDLAEKLTANNPVGEEALSLADEVKLVAEVGFDRADSRFLEGEIPIKMCEKLVEIHGLETLRWIKENLHYCSARERLSARVICVMVASDIGKREDLYQEWISDLPPRYNPDLMLSESLFSRRFARDSSRYNLLDHEQYLKRLERALEGQDRDDGGGSRSQYSVPVRQLLDEDILLRRHPFATDSFHVDDLSLASSQDPSREDFHLGYLYQKRGSFEQGLIARALQGVEEELIDKTVNFEDRFQLLLRTCPFKTVVRDVYLEIMLRSEITDLDGDHHLEALDHCQRLLDLFASSEFSGLYAGDVLTRRLKLSDLDARLDDSLEFLLRYFPHASLQRNYFLAQIEDRFALSPSQALTIASLKLTQELESTEGDGFYHLSVINHFAGTLDRVEKRHLLFWLLGIEKSRPHTVETQEKAWDGSLDSMISMFVSLNELERSLLISRFLLGDQGLIEGDQGEANMGQGVVDDLAERRVFFNRLLQELIPETAQNFSLFRQIVLAVLEQSSPVKATQIITDLINLRVNVTRSDRTLSLAEVLTTALCSLGVVGKKVAQSLAEQTWVPDDYRQALEVSQESAKTVSKSSLVEIARQSGLLSQDSPIEIIEFGKKIGAASNKQACLVTARINDALLAQELGVSVGDTIQLVGKFKRPSAIKTTSLSHDLGLLNSVMGVLREEGLAQQLPPSFVSQIERAVTQELDFSQEKQFNQQFSQGLAGKKFFGFNIVTPEIVHASSDIVLERYVPGKSLREVINEQRESIADSGQSRTLRRAKMATLAFAAHNMLRTGSIHADLHPGNIIVMSNNDLGVIDYGMSVRLEAEQLAQVRKLFLGLVAGRSHLVISSLQKLGWQVQGSDVHLIDTSNLIIQELKSVPSLAKQLFVDIRFTMLGRTHMSRDPDPSIAVQAVKKNISSLLDLSQRSSAQPPEEVMLLIFALSKLNTYLDAISFQGLLRLLTEVLI